MSECEALLKELTELVRRLEVIVSKLEQSVFEIGPRPLETDQMHCDQEIAATRGRKWRKRLNRHISGVWSIEEAGLFLGLTTNAIYKMVERQQIPHIKMGSRLRFDPKALSIWLSKRRRQEFDVYRFLPP